MIGRILKVGTYTIEVLDKILIQGNDYYVGVEKNGTMRVVLAKKAGDKGSKLCDFKQEEIDRIDKYEDKSGETFLDKLN